MSAASPFQGGRKHWIEIAARVVQRWKHKVVKGVHCFDYAGSQKIVICIDGTTTTTLSLHRNGIRNIYRQRRDWCPQTIRWVLNVARLNRQWCVMPIDTATLINPQWMHPNTHWPDSCELISYFISSTTISVTILPANQPCNFQMRVLHASGRIRTTRIFVRNDTHSNRPWFVPTSSAPQLAPMFCLRAYPRCGSTDMRLHRPRHSTTVSSKRTDKSHRRPHRNYQQLTANSRKKEFIDNHAVALCAVEFTHWYTIQSSKRIIQLLRSPHREGLELVPVWQHAKQCAEQSQLLHNKSR